jgi:preprotein translocase subunit SecG
MTSLHAALYTGMDLEARGVLRGIGRLILFVVILFIVLGIVLGVLAARMFNRKR